MNAYTAHLLSSGRSAATVKQRVTHIEQLARTNDLYTVTTEDLEAILAARRHTHAAETRKSMVSSWKVFYQWAHRTGRIGYDPTTDLQPVDIPRRLPRIAPDDVVQYSLITATLEQRAMILLARFACLRLSEIASLHSSQRQHDALRIIGKGDKERIVYANEDLLHVLLELERENGPGYYFRGRYGGHMHPQSVNKIITRVTGCNPHSLRHAGATAAYRATHDLRTVQEMLGHASLATTQLYLHSDEEASRRAAAGTAFSSPAPTAQQLLIGGGRRAA